MAGLTDEASYQGYFTTKAYPELFRLAEFDIGGRAALCAFLKQALVSPRHAKGAIYEILAQWPFACYLTTNYDDELQQYLAAIGQHFRSGGIGRRIWLLFDTTRRE